jgi:glycosyltransferase involved in cell wall biosynthesis
MKPFDSENPVPVPMFSVATPTRNALQKLRRCVGSLRGQQGVSYEHLVQDAVSTDSTPGWLQAQAATDPRLKPASESDAGMYDAINRAWSRSGGLLLSWLNSDEQYLPGTLRRVHEWFAAHPNMDALFGDYIVVNEQGHAVALRREIPLRRFYVANSFLNAQSCTLFFRRRLWDEGLLRLDSRYRYAADMDLVLRLQAEGVRFAHLAEPLALFGIDGSNLSTHEGMAKEAEALRLAYGGLRHKPLRALPLAMRRVERLWRGAYRKETVEYRFALDEQPQYKGFRSTGLGGRYSLDNTKGSAEEVSPAAPPP